MSNKAKMIKEKSEHTLTPKLRFPEFRNDENWQAPHLSNLYGFKRTNTLSRDMLSNESGTIRNIHYGDIHTKFQSLFRVDHEQVPFISPDVSVEAFDEKDDCEEGDIVLADASEDLDDVGKALEIISLDGQRVVAGTHTILATRRGNVPVIGFGGYLFQSAAVRQGIQKESQGAKVYGISAKRISSVALPLPITNQEQQKIADCLSSLDELTTAEERKYDALRDYKRSLMQQIFPQPGETQPRLRFPEFRDKVEWTSMKLGRICEFVRGPFGGALKKEIFVPEGYAVYEQSHAIHKDLDTFRYFIDDIKYNELKRFAVKPNDIIMSCSGTMGKIAVLSSKPKPGVINQALLKLSVDKKYNLEFITIALELPENQSKLLAQSAGGAIKNVVGVKLLKEIEIRVPPQQEQARIADCLTALDNQLTAQAEKIETLKSHKRGLMQQIFPAPEEQI
jgi:type I restriction enzyme S subunit